MSPWRHFPINRQTVIRLSLALAVLASSLAWAPAAVLAAPRLEVNAAVQFQATIVGSRLFIDATGLPRYHIYNVRVRERNTDAWIKLARVKADRYGDLADSVRLPNYLARAGRLHVCIKDVLNGRLFCTRTNRRY